MLFQEAQIALSGISVVIDELYVELIRQQVFVTVHLCNHQYSTKIKQLQNQNIEQNVVIPLWCFHT